jgi:hypothetical protein
MNLGAPVKLAVFGAVLAASFGVGLAVGAVAGPVDTGEQHMPADPPATSIVHAEGHGDGD